MVKNGYKFTNIISSDRQYTDNSHNHSESALKGIDLIQQYDR